MASSERLMNDQVRSLPLLFAKRHLKNVSVYRKNRDVPFRSSLQSVAIMQIAQKVNAVYLSFADKKNFVGDVL